MQFGNISYNLPKIVWFEHFMIYNFKLIQNPRSIPSGSVVVRKKY